MDIKENKKHMSVSQIGMVKRCPRQYVFRYIEGYKSPPGIALVVGSSFDEAYNLNYEQKIESKKDLPVREVQEKFSAELDTRINEVESEFERKQKDEIKDTIVRGIPEFHEICASQVQPTEVQKELRIPLDSEYDLLGYVDVITDDHIIDNKTAGKYQAGKYLTQLQAYVYMWHWLTGELKGAALNYLIKTKKPRSVAEPVEGIKPEQFLESESGAINYIKALHKNPDIAFKNTDGWLCSPKWCGFYNECQLCSKGK